MENLLRQSRVSPHNWGPFKGAPWTSQYDSAVMILWVSGGGPQMGERLAESRKSLRQLHVWSVLFFRIWGQEIAAAGLPLILLDICLYMYVIRCHYYTVKRFAYHDVKSKHPHSHGAFFRLKSYYGNGIDAPSIQTSRACIYIFPFLSKSNINLFGSEAKWKL